jgi:hypothetical protein
MLDLSDCEKLKTLPASMSQLTRLDERSRKPVEALLRGALNRTVTLLRWPVSVPRSSDV